MSKVKIEGNASGTGTLTIAAPNTNTDRTLTLPDADITLGGGVDGVDSDYTSGTAVKIDSSGNVNIGSTSNVGYGPLQLGSTSAGSAESTLQFLAISSQGSYIQFGDATTGSPVYAGYLGYAHSDDSLRFGTSTQERMRIDSSGNLKFNSGYGSAATAYGCRAWVNFNGTGTVAIRGSGNVSSITDNGTGDYTVNLTTALPDTNGAPVAGSWRSSASSEAREDSMGTRIASTTTINVLTGNNDAGVQARDYENMYVAVIR